MSQVHVLLYLLLSPDQVVEPHRKRTTFWVIIDTWQNAPNDPTCANDVFFNVRVHPVYKYDAFQVQVFI